MYTFDCHRRPRTAAAAVVTTLTVACAVSLVLSGTALASELPGVLPAERGMSVQGVGPRHVSAPGRFRSSSGETARSGRVLVIPKAGVSQVRLGRLVGQQGGQVVGTIEAINLHEIAVPEQAEEAVARALSRHPDIAVAELDYGHEPNYTVPDDPRYGNAWHLPMIDAPQAWSLSKGDGVIVAVLDTGIDLSHADFVGQLVPGWNSTLDSDEIHDYRGHGTWVAGAVGAATDNATGVASVGWNVKIMPVRVTNDPDGIAWSNDMIRGLTWAADNGAHIANMSYRSWRHETVQAAARYMRDKGGLVFGSAGNEGTDHAYTPTADVIVVSATGSDDQRTSWSNYGAYVDLAAPGASIQTTGLGGGYTSRSGTSFSSPIAAGVAALVMAANPQLTAAQVEKILLESAVDLGAPGWDQYYGWGRVDAGSAVSMAWSTAEDREAPEVAFLSPEANASVEGQVEVVIEATDNEEVTRVVLYADALEVGTVYKAPFQFVWDPAAESKGTVRLRAEAFDSAGNVGTESIEVSVQHPVIEPEPEPAPELEPAPEFEPEPEPEHESAPALTLTSTSINEGRVWTAVVTLNGPEGAPTAGSWDFGRNNAGGCTIESGSTSCSFSLSGIRKNIGSVTYTDKVNNLSVTVGKP